MQENIVAKYFCGFNLCERTPDHSTFGKLRDRLGTEGIANIFNQIGLSLKQSGYIAQCFRFVDASHIVTKAALWKERDRALAAQEAALR
jgi:IS5 family transposase